MTYLAEPPRFIRIPYQPTRQPLQTPKPPVVSRRPGVSGDARETASGVLGFAFAVGFALGGVTVGGGFVAFTFGFFVFDRFRLFLDRFRHQ